MTQQHFQHPDLSSLDSDRKHTWESTMTGKPDGRYIRAHKDPVLYIPFDPDMTHTLVSGALCDLRARFELEEYTFSPSATFSRELQPSVFSSLIGGLRKSDLPLGDLDFRTRFEHDRDSILHSEPFRRLAGKTQVHLNPDDHQRTRLTHALEVTQIARALAQALRLNVALTEAIALGHDCGHGPGGHASEDAFEPYLSGGFNHATFGADVTLRSLDLNPETLDGIRNHSWSLNTPATPEAEVVSFADRIAYVCHDLEDALACNMISRRDFPNDLAAFMNHTRGDQIGYFIRAVIQGSLNSGSIAILKEYGELLGAMRSFNNEKIYHHQISQEQNVSVIQTLSELVDFYCYHTDLLPERFQRSIREDGQGSVEAVVEYVAGMTDDFAYRCHDQYVKNASDAPSTPSLI